MPAKWTGDVVAALHINGITQADLAAKMGVTVPYISMLLNGKKSATGAKDRMMEAIREIKADKAKEIADAVSGLSEVERGKQEKINQEIQKRQQKKRGCYMPRVNLGRKPENDALVKLIWGAAAAEDACQEKVAGMAGFSIRTLQKRKKDPSKFTVEELRKLGRGLHIPIEEMRAALRY